MHWSKDKVIKLAYILKLKKLKKKWPDRSLATYTKS
jgi:hypothetical protein